jgi:hypothetical protein
MNLADIIIHGTKDQLADAVQAGADVNAIDEYGFTPLIETTIVNNIELSQIILDAGADVHEVDMSGGTALHWAVENHNLPLCELLLKHQANPNAYNKAGQPVLLNPILRQQNDLKVLLYQHGAKLTFAQDYINTKLLGHRFELTGHVDIVDPQKKFVEIDLEGFFLEFTLNVITHSMMEYLNNFASRPHRKHFPMLQYIIHAMQNASELIKYQQYQVQLAKHEHAIHELLDHKLKIIPVNFEGHAVTLVSYEDLLAICDRRNEYDVADSIGIFKLGHPERMNHDFIKMLIYQKKDQHFMTKDLAQHLGLKLLCHYPVSKQIAGNCSWANVEAALPAAFAILNTDFDQETSAMMSREDISFKIFRDWREWDKDRALHFCIESFYEASAARKASKLSLLATILFQRCSIMHENDIRRAKKIIRLLKTPGYEYILKSYRQIYEYNKKTQHGYNLTQLLELFEDESF